MPAVPELTPPGETPNPEAKRDRSAWWFAAGLVILVLIGVAVVLVLPEHAERSGPATDAAPASVAEPSGILGIAPARIDHRQRSEAEAALAKAMRLRALLETQEVTVWGGEDYAKLLEQLSQADAAFNRGDFTAAAEGYRRITAGLEQLRDTTEERYTAALDDGHRALEAGDAETAERQFRIALALRPDDDTAMRGLQRSQNLPRLLNLNAQGQALESQQRWESAREAYAEALSIDPEYPQALDGLSRAEAALKEQAFKTAMNALFEALGRGDYARAQQALTLARDIDPGAAELSEAAAQLTQARTGARLRRLRAQAEEAVAEERWQSAAGLYRSALKLDPMAAFARTGLEEAERYMALQTRLQGYIDQPERLQTPKVLANARAILKQSATITDPGPKLRQQQEALKSLVSASQRPVRVHLYSDGHTEVIVYRVGRFGRFDHRQLSLRPGTYTAVGTREGYRDVRRVLKITPGKAEQEFTIRCEEPI